MSPLSRCFMATVVAGVGLAATAAQAQTVILNETFGNSADRVASPYVPRSQVADPGYYGARLTGPVVDGSYTIMRPQNINASTASTYWDDLTVGDHTQDPGGALMVLNAGNSLDAFYRRTFAVQPGFSYRISVWRYTVNPDLTQTPPGPIAWSLEVQDVGAAPDAFLVKSGDINNNARYTWEESTFTFTVPADCAGAAGGGQAMLALRNRSPITGGNDIYIDDITVTRLPLDSTAPTACPAPPPSGSSVTAVKDSASTPVNTATTIPVLTNDSTPVGNLGTPTLYSPPANGTALINPDGTITYTPITGFTGIDTFQYQICNDATPQSCAVATVTVRVGAAAPTAVPALGGTEMALLGGLLAAVGVGVRRRQQRAAKR